MKWFGFLSKQEKESNLRRRTNSLLNHG